MIRYIFIVAFVLLNTENLKAQTEEPYKEWDKNAPLQWSDFKGPVDHNNGGFAGVYTANVYRYRYTTTGGKRKFEFNVSTRMATHRSWSKPENQTPELLISQQINFDITKFIGLLLKKELEAGNYTNNFQAEIQQIYNANNAQLRLMRGRYYVATAFAGDPEATQQWTAYIADLLSHDYTLAQAKKLEPVITLKNTPKRKLWVTNELLTWNDFKGPINDTSKFSAATSSGFVFTARVEDNGNLPVLKFTAASDFRYYDSWTRPARQSEELLLHEQMHFNISEFMARVMLKVLSSYHYSVNFQDDIGKLVKQGHAWGKLMQNTYDGQTDHSKNKPMQKKWEQYIALLLSKDFTITEAFAGTPGGPVAFNQL